MAEQLPRLALWPDQQHASTHCRDEVMRPPPALDAGTVHLQNGLANGQCTIVPHEQEQKRQFEGAIDVGVGRLLTSHT